MTLGPAIGWGFSIDETTLDQFVACAAGGRTPLPGSVIRK